jgi:hypothetical protein
MINTLCGRDSPMLICESPLAAPAFGGGMLPTEGCSYVRVTFDRRYLVAPSGCVPRAASTVGDPKVRGWERLGTEVVAMRTMFLKTADAAPNVLGEDDW